VTTRFPAFFSLVAVSTLVVMSTYACSSDSKKPPGIIEDNEGGLIEPRDDGGTGGRPGATTTRIGRNCVRDVDCGGQGLRCMTPASTDLGGGGPPGGYCVADCSDDPAACRDIDPNSVCVRFSASATTAGPAFCVEACTVGQTAAATDKCHGRQDVACDEFTVEEGEPLTGEGFCRPTCRGDFDCGTRKCDLGSGFCVDASDITGTLPIGSPCDPSPPEECAGACFALTEARADGPGMCAALCSLGSPGCGIDPNSNDLPSAACLFGLTDSEPGLGDLGLCGRLCNDDCDCTAFERVCRPWTDPADEEASGFKGYCGGQFDANRKPSVHLACADAGTPDSGTTTTTTTDAGRPGPVSDAAAD
jgi:hypothetical protein